MEKNKKINFILIAILFTMSIMDGIITWIYAHNSGFVEYNPILNLIFLNYGKNILLLVKIVVTFFSCGMLLHIIYFDKTQNSKKINTAIVFGCIVYGLLTCYWIIFTLIYLGYQNV